MTLPLLDDTFEEIREKYYARKDLFPEETVCPSKKVETVTILGRGPFLFIFLGCDSQCRLVPY